MCKTATRRTTEFSREPKPCFAHVPVRLSEGYAAKTYSDMMEAVILNTSGGMTDGDILNIDIEAEDCALVMTTQSAERVYRSGGTRSAKIKINLSVSNTADLHWLPQETIVFNDLNLNGR